jgi:formylglycine-generating enzyme required for sulfatase activity
MVLVPEGEFMMGSDEGDEGADHERPVHAVYLDAYYIDVYEVTNGLYRECVQVGACRPPRFTFSGTHSDYWDNREYNNYPVITVVYDDALNFCKWRGARLPTEAEWEKAARWDPKTGEVTTYPWGDNAPTPLLANYAQAGYGDAIEVGSLNNASPVGAYDMAGNVWEWVADWYDGGYYAISPYENPLGPPSSTSNLRIARGGTWMSLAYQLRSAFRWPIGPEFITNAPGFRCAADVPPPTS